MCGETNKFLEGPIMAQILSDIKTAVHSAYVKTAENYMGTLAQSEFLANGVLTPEEVFLSIKSVGSHPLVCSCWRSLGTSLSHLVLVISRGEVQSRLFTGGETISDGEKRFVVFNYLEN